MNSSSSIFELGFDRNQTVCEPIELKPDKPIPEWLSGQFIRNGPGLFYIGNNRFNHWFDGLAMLHKFDFRNGKVRYQSDFLDCEASRQSLSGETLTYSEFATDPCWSIFGKLRSMFRQGPTDSAKVNLAKIGDQYFALGETTMQIAFDPDTLESLGTYNFQQPKFGTSSTAHPHIENSDAYNLITKYGPIDRYQILKMDDSATKIASVITTSPAYMHSFGMSEKYYVLAESPFTVNSLKLIANTKPFIENFKWDNKRGTKIWVIDRSTGKVVLKKEIEPFFFFHFVNTFDTDDGLSFDIVTYPNAAIIKAYYLDRLKHQSMEIPKGKLHRVEIDLKQKTSNISQISGQGIELPHIDYDRYNMNKAYNFVYAMGLSDANPAFYDQITKINISDKSSIQWSEQGCFPGEPVFIASPESQQEDEGIILTLVIDTNKEASFLLILNAANLEEISRIPTPEPILAGFHGNFFKNIEA